jgi:hypothetical protein
MAVIAQTPMRSPSVPCLKIAEIRQFLSIGTPIMAFRLLDSQWPNTGVRKIGLRRETQAIPVLLDDSKPFRHCWNCNSLGLDDRKHHYFSAMFIRDDPI